MLNAAIVAVSTVVSPQFSPEPTLSRIRKARRVGGVGGHAAAEAAVAAQFQLSEGQGKGRLFVVLGTLFDLLVIELPTPVSRKEPRSAGRTIAGRTRWPAE